jgi:hypothetical protein
MAHKRGKNAPVKVRWSTASELKLDEGDLVVHISKFSDRAVDWERYWGDDAWQQCVITSLPTRIKSTYTVKPVLYAKTGDGELCTPHGCEQSTGMEEE